MVTRAFADGFIDAAGKLQGDLNLHSEHDFTWSHWFYTDPSFPLDELSDRLYAAGLRTIEGEVGVYGAYLYEGHHFGSYDPATHRARVESEFVAALERRGIDVNGGVANYGTMAIPAGSELARWESVPLSVALWPINHKSHNEMADILNRHIGYVVGGSSDYIAGSEVVLDWLGDIGVDTTGAALFDGSGLDTRNRFTARQQVELYAHMLSLPVGAAWRRSLSIGGAEGPGSTDSGGTAYVTENTSPYNGTLAFRMTSSDTAGRVFGKSGTNAGITTSGVLFNRYDGRRYLFSFEMNEISSGSYGAARAVQDELVESFAGDLFDGDLLGGEARPGDPVLHFVGDADGKLVVEWQPVPGIDGIETVDGYYVYSSDDGKRWDRTERTYVLDTSYAHSAPTSSVRYFRVTAVNEFGESDPSDVYAGRATDTGSSADNRVLVVDANDRWQSEPADENLMGAAHTFVERYATALPDVVFDTCDNEAISDGGVQLDVYSAVIWAAGEESTTRDSFDAVEQAAVNEYLSGGGKLFASGAEIGWDLSAQGSVPDSTFYEGKLHADFEADDSGVFAVRGNPGSIFEDIDVASFWSPGEIFVAYPDVIGPLDGATSCLAYDAGNGSAGVQFEGTYQLVYLGFPFESVNDAETRRAIMHAVMSFFGLAD